MDDQFSFRRAFAREQIYFRTILIALLFIAFILRLGAVSFGIPQSFYGDELVSVVGGFKILQSGSLWGNSFLYIPPLFSYILAPFFGVAGVAGILLGWFSGVHEFQQYVLLHREEFLVIARILSALFGTATVYILYLLGRNVFSKHVALLSAVFLVFDFLHVHETQTGRFWGPTAFFVVAGIYSIVKMKETRRLLWYVLAVFAIGFGYGMGYIILVLLPWFFWAHMHGWRGRRMRNLVMNTKEGAFFDKSFMVSLVLLCAIIVFFSLANPYAFQRQFGWLVAGVGSIFGFSFQHITTKPVGGGIHLWTNILNVSRYFWSESPLFLLGAAGLIGWWRANNGKFFEFSLFLGMPLLYLAGLIFGFSRIEPRFILPVVPPLLLGSSYAFFLGFSKQRTPFVRYLLLVFFTFGFFWYSVYPVYRYGALMSSFDTRTQAVEWIQKNVPLGSVIILDDYTVYVPMNKESAAALKENNPVRFDTRAGAVLGISPDSRLYEPGYFVYDISRFQDIDGEFKKIPAGYLFYSYWNARQKRELEARYAGLDKVRVVGFAPRRDGKDAADILNDPMYPADALSGREFSGPYVEIYTFKNR
ncbi:MAG: Glycosyl transferase family 39 [Parcubacteria group bacterium GW2011_GWA2_47_10]|nr:MAG: Glycosyl transferase family 39 [Parcubacteria group bacterium GW2011_GWA2_47_10]